MSRPKPPRRWGLPIIATVATLLIAAAITASTLMLISHETDRRATVKDAAALGYVREFMTAYTTLDPFHANDVHADRILAQGTGEFAQDVQGEAERDPDSGRPRRAHARAPCSRRACSAGTTTAAPTCWLRRRSATQVAGREVDDRERKPLGCNGYQGRTAVEDQPADSGDLTTAAEGRRSRRAIGCRCAELAVSRESRRPRSTSSRDGRAPERWSAEWSPSR